MRAQGRMGGPMRGQPRLNRGQHGPGFMERLRDLPPEEQERVLSNDERFRSLPPERQARVRENLRRWNALRPEQKELIRERQRIFASLTPAQRQEARALSGEWRDLPPERRRDLRQAFRRMRDLPPSEREKFLAGEEIKSRFSPQEIHLLRGLGLLLPEGHTPESSGPPPEPQD